MNAADDPRFDALLEALLAYARADFSQRIPISDALDVIDAISTGLNMMADDLSGAVASRQELEAAYRSLQEAQARVVHSGKLIAVGQLASGVAHEINNPSSWVLMSLGLISRHLALLREQTDGATSLDGLRSALAGTVRVLEGSLTDALAGMERIRTVTNDLRTFSRMDGDELELLSLSEVASAAANLAGPYLRARARVSVELGEGPWVLGNRGRLAQVVTNLLINAAQAVEHLPRPEHRIRLEVRADGDDALLAVEDSGTGLRPELRERIFEPFFTTKPACQGTGLGLSLVAEIVHRLQGTVQATEATLGGARFEVRLPRAERPQPRSESATVLAQRTPRMRVLIVDDEPNLLRTYALALQPDHDICVAHGGAAAIARLEVDRAFDAVVCDLQMPEIDGIGVFEQLQRFAPELLSRLIFSTGGVYQERIKEFLRRTSIPVLEKPVTPELLLQTLLQRRTPPR
ncbi:MAG: ATP-binding protein [Myxococcota bacterium]|nr:ATP-binding protein [Myxococcota bacterium]